MTNAAVANAGPVDLSGEVGFRFGASPSEFESACGAARGTAAARTYGIDCKGLTRDGSLVREVSMVSAGFVDGKLARMVVYSREEPSVVAARVEVRIQPCTRGRFGECIFNANGALDEAASVEVQDRKWFGQKGSAVTIVTRRSIEDAKRRGL